ncbi:hypothetical protein QR98_0021830 [Sarcoptes scabiei]|uniref:Uncharacterized protein n=1 Tax=Sarcoptes scabiei TaxID=52283 RepID=A0A131ZZ06_SARSC|nr:hypothetical protein QR98_0021830 [Sarcoptes scabiei]
MQQLKIPILLLRPEDIYKASSSNNVNFKLITARPIRIPIYESNTRMQGARNLRPSIHNRHRQRNFNQNNRNHHNNMNQRFNQRHPMPKFHPQSPPKNLPRPPQPIHQGPRFNPNQNQQPQQQNFRPLPMQPPMQHHHQPPPLPLTPHSAPPGIVDFNQNNNFHPNFDFIGPGHNNGFMSFENNNINNNENFNFNNDHFHHENHLHQNHHDFNPIHNGFINDNHNEFNANFHNPHPHHDHQQQPLPQHQPHFPNEFHEIINDFVSNNEMFTNDPYVLFNNGQKHPNLDFRNHQPQSQTFPAQQPPVPNVPIAPTSAISSFQPSQQQQQNRPPSLNQQNQQQQHQQHQSSSFPSSKIPHHQQQSHANQRQKSFDNQNHNLDQDRDHSHSSNSKKSNNNNNNNNNSNNADQVIITSRVLPGKLILYRGKN